jgi:Tfp pilus assembly protein PilF
MYSQSRRPGTGGMNSRPVVARLEIQLTVGQSRPLMETQVYVEISSGQGGTTRGFTDTNGRVNFDVLSGVNYELEVSGPVKTKSVSFLVPFAQRYHHEEVEVELHRGETAKEPGGMVSSATLNVPENARQEFAKGMKDMNSHNWSKAREHFQKAVKNYPRFDWGYNNIGVTYIQEKNNTAALEAFAKAVAINDKNADAVRNLARMKLMQNDCAGGKALLLKLGPDPKDSDALMMLAFAELNLHEFEPALANALKVHQSEPDRFPLGHLIAAQVYEMKGDSRSAQAQYQIYLKEAPDSPEAQAAKQGMQRVTAKN